MLTAPPADPAVVVHHGSVELTLAERDGRTRLVTSRTRPPLLVQKALYPDGALPGMAFVFLSNSTGGIFQGDEHRISVEVESGAAAHVTTQSSTKVHAMPAGLARQDVELKVDMRGYLEYLPDPVIPYQGADYGQHTSISVQPGGALIYWDVFAPGRAAMGEFFCYRRLSNRLEVLDGSGCPTYLESFILTPSTDDPMMRGVLGSSGFEAGATLGSMLVVAEMDRLERLAHELQESLPTDREVAAGVTRLPNHTGLGIRAIGRDTADVQAVLVQCWSVARQHLLGVEVPFVRKY